MVEVGAGKAVIDLEGVLPHDGFAAQLDTPHVRAIAFRNPDGARACLVSVDATSLRDDADLRAAAAQATGCTPGHVWVAATHTFSMPHVRTPEHLANDDERGRNTLYATRLVEAVRDACTQAANALVPATFAVASGTCAVNANRDVETPEGWWLGIDPAGFSDHGVRTLAIRTASDGAPLATVFSADVQASVLQGARDEQGRLLASADLAGNASALLERELGGAAIFMVGAAGDQTPREKGPDALPGLASGLAGAVLSSLGEARPLDVTRLELNQQVVACPAQRRHDFATLAPTRSYAFEQLGTEETLVSSARLGNLVVVGLQPEVDSAFGARLRNAFPSKLEILTMVNGAQKYLPSSEAYDRITYEAMNSGFARGADKVLERAIISMVG